VSVIRNRRWDNLVINWLIGHHREIVLSTVRHGPRSRTCWFWFTSLLNIFWSWLCLLWTWLFSQRGIPSIIVRILYNYINWRGSMLHEQNDHGSVCDILRFRPLPRGPLPQCNKYKGREKGPGMRGCDCESTGQSSSQFPKSWARTIDPSFRGCRVVSARTRGGGAYVGQADLILPFSGPMTLFLLVISLFIPKNYHDVYSMLASALPKPEWSNRSSGLIRNSYLLNKQMIIDNSWLGLANTQDGKHLFCLWRSKGMTVDIWIRDYNPPRCFQ
jgi:hypothetical protein